jgi:hypothetical protein
MMSYTGFHLTRLTLKGLRVPDAEVRFRTGLNVIFGPSDTGKTFIAQCVDFMFGASRTPKDIPQAAPYDTVYLGVGTTGADDEFVLERSLRGGDFRLHASDVEDRLLGAKHQPDNKETVSHFMLSLSGLTGKMVRTNQQGKTRQLSFRDIARLVLVDETSVISELSPVFSGHRTPRTAENSVFRFMVTGVDDASVIAKKDPKVMRGMREGKSEVIESLLERERAQIAELKVEEDETALREQLTRVEISFEDASQALAAEQQSAAALEAERREAWERLRQVDSRLDLLSELQRRFELLQEQYTSDLRRLESISEAGARLGQMKEVRCPVCGALAEHHEVQHQSPHASSEDVASSCKAEAEKIRTLLTDLQWTLNDNQKEVERLEGEQKVKREDLETAGTRLRKRLQPRVQAAIQKLRENQEQRDEVRRAIELLERIRELEQLLAAIEKAPKRERADGPATAVGADEAEDFSIEAESLLRSWYFPDLERVTFSEEDQDLVISGERRSSHGKGVRAITHSAFNLALLKYCRTGSKPHPGMVLIDSPLIVYRQPDPGEDTFTHDVKEGFYRSLAKTFADSQVIILENDAPPADLGRTVNVIEFTGTVRGRQGFIPGHG